jgi:hypothetical protein
MFEFLRGRAKPAIGRPNCIRPALEELERRNVPAALVASTSIVFSSATARTAAIAGQPSTIGYDNGAAGQIPALFNGRPVAINAKLLSENAVSL